MPWLRSLGALFLCGAVAAAGDWPEWLGPTRDGVSPEKVTPWEEAPEVLWRQPAGEGHSAPVVAGGRVFVFAKVKDKEEEDLTALNAKTGEVLWRKAYPRGPFTSEFGNGPRATPTVADGRVYTFGVTGVLSCSDAETGKVVWQVDTLKEFAAPNLRFGASCSPLVEGDKVLVNVGAKGASVVAFAKGTGKEAWKALDDPASYSSPIALGAGKERQVVFLTQKAVVSLNPADGAVNWKFPLVDLLSESSTTPVRLGDLLLASSVTYGSVGLRLTTKEDMPAVSQAWKNPALTCWFSTPVAADKDHVFMVTGTILPPQVTLRCVEAGSGKTLWDKARIGKYHASLLRTGNNKLLLLDDGGNLMLLDPSPKEYRELARAKVCGETWSHPALADGKLIVRDAREVICLRLGK
jgi:outer membrane protein assembly factor BamB